jgi:hypothetical protein
MLLSSIKYLSSIFLLTSLSFSSSIFSLPTPNFVITKAKSQLRDNVQYINVDADFGFTEPVLDALHNGVSMVIVLEVELYRQRAYLWDEKITVREQRFTIEFFNLSEQYLVNNNHSGMRYTAMTLQSAINKLREIQPMAIIENSLLLDSESYYAQTRVRLSLDSLPVPLQLNAYISTNWWLYSDWFVWPVDTKQAEAG